MWQSYVQAFLLALALSGMGFGIAQVVVLAGERLIERRHGTVGLRDMLARRAKLEQGLEARRAERAAALKKADEEVRAVIARRQHLERQLKDTLHAGDHVVRQVGDEVKGTPCFIAQVTNKYVGTGADQTREHAFIDRSWSQPQTIEVWTTSLPEARKEIERRYPPAFGYVVMRVQQIAGASAAEPARKAS
ncbi:MAG TPA: hypothetical protein VD995_18340 [Azospirillum sp.]|nr:hypothetical protein [Azospirillum sp.]